MTPVETAATPPLADACESSHAVPAGSWRLFPDRATALAPRRAGVLTITRGRVWLTTGRGGAGDQVLCANDSVALQPGLRAVLEDWPLAGAGGGAAFRWDPVPAPCAVAPPAEPALARPWLGWHGLAGRAAAALQAARGRWRPLVARHA